MTLYQKLSKQTFIFDESSSFLCVFCMKNRNRLKINKKQVIILPVIFIFSLIINKTHKNFCLNNYELSFLDLLSIYYLDKAF